MQSATITLMSIISNCTESSIQDAAKSLIHGNLVAFPTETVYGLGADACNEVSVARIYEVKGRPIDHPLIVHISSIVFLSKWAREVPEYAIKLAREYWPGPMTLILPRTDLAKDFITGGQNNVGIRVPSHTVALALLKAFEDQGGLGVAAPSANRFGKVSPTCADDVKSELFDYLGSDDLILDGGTSLVGIESTIINCTGTRPNILRPGAITSAMINDLLGTKIQEVTKYNSDQLRGPGLLESHYSPKAKVHLSGTPAPGDGFIALNSVLTPSGAIRLANPSDNNDYAHILYTALRQADKVGILNIFIVAPTNDGVGIAINDRIVKAASGINPINPEIT
jgi:L-threonylcarbamoyladenylate synthase